MKLPVSSNVAWLAATCGGAALALLLWLKNSPEVVAQNRPAAAPAQAAAAAGSTNVANATNTAPATNAVAGSNAVAPAVSAQAPTSNASGPAAAPFAPAPAAAEGATPGAPEEMQLAFQNANIDMIVQWLAKNTGKSVVKHPRVQCQLTIVSSKKLQPRDALNLIYRALSLEGFNVIESSKSILIVPDGQEPKATPEFVSNGAVPEGRQRLIRIFTLQNVEPSEIRDKIKNVLSDKGTIEIVDRAQQLMVTDYTDNIRLAGELIRELDVPSASDSTIEFLPLKHANVDEVSALLTQILSAQAGGSKSGPSAGSGSSGPPNPGGPMPGPSPMPSPGPSPSGGGGGSAAANVKIWPDTGANRLIVSAPKSKLPEIKSLLEVLDREKVEDVSLRVITLRNVSAEDLVREISPVYQRMNNKGGKDRVEVTANLRSNSIIVYSSEENFRSLEKLIASLDREEAQEKVMRVFNLVNADAEDVAKQLETLQEGQQNTGRYPFYIFSFGGGGGDRGAKKPSFVADRRRNSVIVQAAPSDMTNIENLIKTLDGPMADGSIAPKIFRLKFVSAVDIEDVLNELFLRRQQQRNYWDPYESLFNSGSRSGDSAGGKLFGKIRITSEPYSNSIIVTANSPEGLDAVEKVLKELDSPSQAGETTMRIELKFARSTTVASSLNILFAKNGSPPLRPQAQPNQPQDGRPVPQQQNSASQSNFDLERENKEDAYFPWLGGQQDNPFGNAQGGRSSSQRPVSDLVGRVRVVPDRRSNALLITSNLHFFPQILKLITDLDTPTPQVLIEAKIIEVASDFRDKLGVRWSPDGSTFTGDDLDNSVKVETSTAYQKIFAGTALGNALSQGVLKSSVNVDFLIQALRKNTDAKVLAQPQINIADNELGKLFVGSQVPFISGSLNTDVGGRNDTFQYRDVGIILELTPHINTDGEVALKIRTESSSIRNGETLFGGAILDTRNFRTDLMVKDGETVVLGGIIQREQSNTNRKVPGLGSIPGLGWAFRKKDKVSREVELIVFLRPKITRTPAQARELLRDLEDKVPMIKRWENGEEDDGKKEAAPKPKA